MPLLCGSSARDCVKCEVSGDGAVLEAPLVEEAAIAHGDVVGGAEADSGGGAVNPVRGAFEFGVVANGGLVDDAMSFAVMPFGAPFLVAEGGDEAEREEDLGESAAVGDLGFSFDAVFVGVFAGTVVGEALVRHCPAACIATDAENLGARAHLAVWGVEEDVALKAAGGVQRESRGLKALGESGQVVHLEFDLGLYGHRKERVYGSGSL